MARRAVPAICLVLLVLIVAAMTRQAGAVPTLGARVMHLTFGSRDVHARISLTIVVPASASRSSPLVIFLHGRGGDENSELSPAFFHALRAAHPAPVFAFPDGGDHSYWHNRRGGAWGSYVLHEVLPRAVSATHADPRRVAIGGISMGGFGAYDIARLAPQRFCAVGGHSAALWTSGGASAPGAFDSAAAFAAHDVIAAARARPRLYRTTRLWLDGGDADPFHAADETFARALGISMHVWPGGHDGDYWNAHWDDYMRFYAAALAHCRT